MHIRILAAAFLIAVVACERHPSAQPATRGARHPPTDAPAPMPMESAANAPAVQLISYEIIERVEAQHYKVSFDVRVDLVDGRLPTETELGAISKHLKGQEGRDHDRTFVNFYLPNMTPGAGAFCSANHTPSMTVEIHPYFVPEQYQHLLPGG